MNLFIVIDNIIKLGVSGFMIGLVAFLILIDIILYTNDVEGDTISNQIRDWVYDRYFFITFVWGALAGHFFLGTSSDQAFGNQNVWFIVGLTAILWLIGILYPKKIQLNKWQQLCLFIVGVIAGHYLWPINVIS